MREIRSYPKSIIVIIGAGTAPALPTCMISLSRMTDVDADQEIASASPVVSQPKCFAVTIFTHRYTEVRDFYVDILNATIQAEKPGRVCEMDLAGMPLCLRAAEHGELVSYFHLHLLLKQPEAVLAELRRRGIIVTSVGPFTNFRDPEGRVIKLSEERVAVA